MEIRELTMDEVEEIYHREMVRDFPEDELKPLSAIRVLYEHGLYLCLGYFDGPHPAAYACYLTDPDKKKLLLDYYAVIEGGRGKGVGSAFLQAMFERLKDAEVIVGEVENPDFAETDEERTLQSHRIGFYQKNGFAVAAPDQTCRLYGVEYRIIVKGLQTETADAAEHAAEIINEMYHLMFPEKIFGKKVIVRGLDKAPVMG